MILHRLNPWRRKRAKRLEQYLEAECHECRDAVEHHRKERDQKERQIDLALHHEGREGSNWLENREMRISEMVLAYERMLIAVRIDIRKKLSLECPDMLSDAELAKLEGSILRSVESARSARRDDYERRARAAGVATHRPKQRDAAEYGELDALVRREIRKLQLDRSLGRIVKPAATFGLLARRFWDDPVWSKVIATFVVAVLGAMWAWPQYWRLWLERPGAEIQLSEVVSPRTPISVKYANVPLNRRLWLAIQGADNFWTYGTCGEPPGSLVERTSSTQQSTRDHETGTWSPREEISIGSKRDAGKSFTVFLVLVSESTDRDIAYEFKNHSESCGKPPWEGREKLPPGRILAQTKVTRR